MALWTPAEITTALWLDAAASGTIHLDGTSVSQWDDKSGNDMHVSQGTSAQRPDYISEAYNGLNTVRFNGTSHNLFRTTITISQAVTVLSVCKTNVTSGSSGSRQYVYDGYSTVDKSTERCLLALRGNQTNRPAIYAGEPAAWGTHTSAVTSNLTMEGRTDKFIPAPYDPVWGSTSGNLEWKEVKKDGYYLPKHKYHQVEVTLRDNATLEKIIMAPAIRTQDIQSKSYKNIYLKADVPGDALIDAYEARLKTWWGVNE